MKVIVAQGQGQLKVAEVPMPEPSDYQCLCKILACATCSGTDRKIVAGTLPWTETYPGILGHESVGRVVQVGRRVRYVRETDLVFRPTAVYPGEQLGGYTSLWGGFAEYGLITDLQALREDQPAACPNNYCIYQQTIPSDIEISAADATILITLKEVASSVANAGVGFRTSLVILGTGSVAAGMCFFAKLYGAWPVIVIGRRDEPLAHVRTLGADFIINNRSEDAFAQVQSLTDGRGADIVIDTTGDPDLLQNAARFLALHGKLVPYGTGDSFEYRVDRQRGLAQWNLVFSGPSEELAHQYLMGLQRLKLLPLSSFYSDRMPFDEFVPGFEKLKQRKASKIVYEMAD
jgi:threonine dehydrogenase-like Zn-dependent dehydrogenase